jgi:hypothetical protein
MASQGLLFSEPSIAETGVWCNLSEGIDPAEWASLCRYIGTLSPEEFEQVQNEIVPDPDIVKSNQNGLFHRTDILIDIPLVSLGPSGIGGEYQRESI